jgi:hypothetical protein
MSGAQWQVAQVNIGRARGAIDGPIMAEFVAMLAEINAVAEQTPGFVWRLQTEDGAATAIRPYADERIMINMSVWADLESLRGYVFRSAHAAVMRRRREWFERFEGIYVALWWVPVGYRPTAEEAVTRWLTSRRTVPRRCIQFSETVRSGGPLYRSRSCDMGGRLPSLIVR